jgi:cytochrome c
VLTAATLGEQQVLATADYLAQPRYVIADAESGAQQAQVCRACHSFDKGGPTLIGPKLHGMFGRAAGGRDDYEYSRALTEADFIWTPRALEAWLAQPSRFMPGNRMSFAGVLNEQKRADLVAYLLTATSD